MGTEGRVTLNAYEGLALGLALAASEAAGEAARIGGYQPTHAQWGTVAKALAAAAFGMVALVEDWSAVTDEQLEGAARDMGVRVLGEVLGPPSPELIH
jgi:hypothetical protein